MFQDRFSLARSGSPVRGERVYKFGVFCAVILIFGLIQAATGEDKTPLNGQPLQIWSEVHYDPKLTDPFFESNEWSYPWWIIKHPDGHFESTRSDYKSPVKDPPRLKHTAKCFSTRFYKHPMNFCEARALDANEIDLFIKSEGAAFTEIMRLQIRNGKFTSEYTVASSIPTTKGLRCAEKRRELTLDKERYRKGDVIKGRIDFECIWESTDPKHPEDYSKNPTGFKVYGVFKTVVK